MSLIYSVQHNHVVIFRLTRSDKYPKDHQYTHYSIIMYVVIFRLKYIMLLSVWYLLHLLLNLSPLFLLVVITYFTNLGSWYSSVTGHTLPKILSDVLKFNRLTPTSLTPTQYNVMGEFWKSVRLIVTRYLTTNFRSVSLHHFRLSSMCYHPHPPSAFFKTESKLRSKYFKYENKN